MKGFLRLFIMSCLAMTLVHCASSPTDESEDGAPVEESAPEASTNDFEDFDNGGSDPVAEESAPSEDPASTEESAPSENQSAGVDDSLEQEMNEAEGAPAAEDEFAQFDDQEQAPQAAEPTPEMEPAPVEDPPPPVIADEFAPAPEEPMAEEPIPAPEVATEETMPPPEEPAAAPEEPAMALVNIKNIRYQPNDGGGTVVVEADGPLSFQTRTNTDTNQFVIEVAGAKLPAKLKRPFNTKDMKGGIGAIDAYQNSGSTTARIVVQLRAGASEPVVQAEGNSLLIVEGGAAAPPTEEVAEASTEEEVAAEPETPSNILSSSSLQEFLAGNMQFYGKRISLETSEMDVREVFKLISEESNVNLVLSDDVRGTVSLKLRQVPWDQALVMVMKTKKLGYTRTGNVIRIAPIADIRVEEEDSIRLSAQRKAQEPLKVRMVPVSYARIEDLVTQVNQFKSERGKIVGDPRTSSIVISDTDENIERILKLVQSIDVPPPQVLIEGKVVEASDSFQRTIGINWASTGRPFNMGGNLRGNSSFSVSPGSLGNSSFGLRFQMGTLDILGSLTANLALFEKQDMVKVLSSPRIVTLHNERAEINQTQEIPLISTNNQNGTTTRSVSFKPVRLRLSVTPQITNDAAVIMGVEVAREFVGAIVDKETQARPVNARSATTKVMVKNGQTAVIGGIYQSDMTQQETKVPVMGDIPVLGWLFKSRDSDKVKNELLIFLTPRILGQADSGMMPSESGDGGDLDL